MGNDAWSNLSTDQKEEHLREATQYLDNNFDWRGKIADKDQLLDWPRKDGEDAEGRKYDKNTIPRKIKEGCAELALVASEVGDLEKPSASGRGDITDLAIGPIDISFEGDSTRTSPNYPRVESMVGDHTRGSEHGKRLLRR